MDVRRTSSLIIGALASGGAAVCLLAAASLVGCGDDTLVTPADAGPDASLATDAAGFETGSFDGSESTDGTLDGQSDAPEPPPARLLLTYGNLAQSQLSVFGLRSGTVDGQLDFPGVGTTAITSSSPWLLEQSGDRVARLDPLQPWLVRSTWNVALDDGPDGGDAGAAARGSFPVAVVVGAGTNGYVLRYTRNEVAVIDTSLDVDDGAPSATVDLSSQVQSGGDGFVEMTAGYFDPQSGLVDVLLGNVDRGLAPGPDGTRPCSATSPTLVAIDTATNMLVSLGSGGGEGGIAGTTLTGYEPPSGVSPMVYDPANNRLLVIERGCTVPGVDGGAPVVIRRGVEAVSLSDGTVTLLLDLSAQTPPQAIFYIDQHHVIVQLAATFMWDPSSAALGAVIAGAPTSFAIDGRGNLIGVRPDVTGDGSAAGATQWSVISVSTADGGITPLGSAAFAPDGGAGETATVTGAQLWPAP